MVNGCFFGIFTPNGFLYLTFYGEKLTPLRPSNSCRKNTKFVINWLPDHSAVSILNISPSCLITLGIQAKLYANKAGNNRENLLEQSREQRNSTHIWR